MKTRKTLAMLMVPAILLAGLTACGQSQPTNDPAQSPVTQEAVQQPTQASTQDPQAAEQPEKEPLDDESAVECMLDDCGISVAYLSEIKVSYPDDKTIKVTFKYNGEEGFYLFDTATGEVLEKEIPEGSEDNAPADPFEAAINAAMATLEDYHGGAENINVSSSGNIITVKFDWNGDQYEFHYDMNAKQIVD